MEWETGLDGFPLRTEAGMRRHLERHDLKVFPSETHGRNDCLIDSLLLALCNAGLVLPALTISARSSICAAVRRHLVREHGVPDCNGYLEHDKHVPAIFEFLRAQQTDIWVDAATIGTVELTVIVFDRFNGRRVSDSNGVEDELAPSEPLCIAARQEGEPSHVQVQLYCCTHRDGAGWHYEWIAPK